MKKRTAFTAVNSAVALMASLVAVAQAEPETPDTPEAASACPAVNIVVAAGSFESTANDSPEDIRGFAHGVNFAAELQNAFPRQVTAWQVPYPSSVSVLGSALDARTLEERAHGYLPYGASRAEGVRMATEHMAELAARCPDVKFLVAGYSQGASVAGDTVTAVGRGTVPGVTSDSILGTYLLADPGRSPLGTETVSLANGAEGIRSATGEVFIPLDQGTPPAHYEGLTGPRASTAFTSFEDRVLSICHPSDPACSTAPGRLPQRVGDALNELEKSPDHEQAVKAGLTDPKVLGVMFLISLPLIVLMLLGIFSPIPKLVASAAGLSGLNDGQRAALRALATELSVVGGVTQAFHQEQSSKAGEAVSPIVWDVDKLSTDAGSSQSSRLSSVAVSQLLKGHHHVPYFTQGGQKPYTIGGKVVDQWIHDDMQARIEAVTQQP